MDKQELLILLARRMNLNRVPGPIVEEAEADGYIAGVLDPEREDTVEELLEFARRRLGFYRRMQNWEQRHGLSHKAGSFEASDEVDTTSIKFELGTGHGEGERPEVLRAAAFEEY